MQNTVSALVWPWREKGAVQAAPRKTGPAATSVLLQAGIMAAIGAALYGWLEHRLMGQIVWGLAGVVLVSGFFIPPVFNAIERFGQTLGRGVGALLTWGLLAPFYYLVFLPLHVLQKITGKDPLHRQFPSSEPTYWVPRKPVASAAQYRKQF